MYHHGFHLTDLREIWYWGFLWNSPKNSKLTSKTANISGTWHEDKSMSFLAATLIRHKGRQFMTYKSLRVPANVLILHESAALWRHTFWQNLSEHKGMIYGTKNIINWASVEARYVLYLGVCTLFIQPLISRTKVRFHSIQSCLLMAAFKVTFFVSWIYFNISFQQTLSLRLILTAQVFFPSHDHT
jgi:hypothetical protein